MFYQEYPATGTTGTIMKAHMHAYRVMVNENSHYMDEAERYEHAPFHSCEEAITACKNIVDDYLLANHSPGMSAEELYRSYTTFGEDPFVLTADEQCQFSAWNYARQRCEVLCAPDSGKQGEP
jgi:hypothetical protein